MSITDKYILSVRVKRNFLPKGILRLYERTIITIDSLTSYVCPLIECALGFVPSRAGDYPISNYWWNKLVCYAFVSKNMRDSSDLAKLVGIIKEADDVETAWWASKLVLDNTNRTRRALKVLLGF